MKSSANPHIINSIAEYHKLLDLPEPEHPLISVIDLACRAELIDLPDNKLIYNFYTIFLKKNIDGTIGYGRKYYDFSNGLMGFSLPMQVFTINRNLDYSRLTGWMLLIHPDFIRQYPLAAKIENYGFFSYNINEALHLSEKEEELIARITHDIRSEYRQPIDGFSQDVIVSHIEVLLNYCNRFYNRQFITRKSSEQEPLARFEILIKNIFQQDDIKSIPSVQELSDELNVSAHYLSDMLRSLTGLSAQQHIHNLLIEKAKQILLTTNLSINETAFKLGFEYPQYFNRLFKNKTGVTPAAFRKDLINS
ncbi:helix-turn-helix domain-containing protein [Dyadobacter psychrotolerans]|uniref:AraC family transcriptional regulator n=1 Tax=Dyadobacter psychrotolerans TaxID=2541721 RepID=A0A4R5DIY8_9BACT|nr:helix-turn-helix transcriptional regulator [Dyadobacter psychrotolerans]TDE10483.1 AraC family transcriptional regulator [Dyadobacter psychrotolerans]